MQVGGGGCQGINKGPVWQAQARCQFNNVNHTNQINKANVKMGMPWVVITQWGMFRGYEPNNSKLTSR